MRKVVKPSKQNNNRKNTGNAFKAIGLVSAIGIDLTVCTLGGFYAGKWLDAKLGGSGIWTGVSVLVGLVVGALSIALVIGKVLRDK